MKSNERCPKCKSELAINQWGVFCSECGYVRMENIDSPSKAILNRFIYKPDKNGCWECLSNWKDRDGYPHCTVNQKKVHIGRYVYEQIKGSIPQGKVLMHTCDNRACINPDHLIIGTQGDNMRDRTKKRRTALGEKNGHNKLTEDQVRLIRKAKLPHCVLARKYGVKDSTIWAIKNHKIWKHVA